MPVTETADQAAIRHAAELLTHWREWAAQFEHKTVTLDIDTIRMLEQQMWAGYAMACAAMHTTGHIPKMAS